VFISAPPQAVLDNGGASTGSAERSEDAHRGALSTAGGAPEGFPPETRRAGGEGKGSEVLWLVGWTKVGSRINVVMSDGRTYTERDPELERGERNAVYLSGEKYFLRRPRDPEKSREESAIVVDQETGKETSLNVKEGA